MTMCTHQLEHEGAAKYGVNAIAFSPDGGWLASGGYDNKVMVRETGSFETLHTLQHDGPVRSCRPAPRVLAPA